MVVDYQSPFTWIDRSELKTQDDRSNLNSVAAKAKYPLVKWIYIKTKHFLRGATARTHRADEN